MATILNGHHVAEMKYSIFVSFPGVNPSVIPCANSLRSLWHTRSWGGDKMDHWSDSSQNTHRKALHGSMTAQTGCSADTDMHTETHQVTHSWMDLTCVCHVCDAHKQVVCIIVRSSLTHECMSNSLREFEFNFTLTQNPFLLSSLFK